MPDPEDPSPREPAHLLGHGTPGGPGTQAPLPVGFRRAEGCPEHVTIEASRVLRIAVRVTGGGLNVVTVERDTTPSIRPAPRERLRDLRPGDRVVFVRSGSPGTVEWVEIDQ